MRTTIAQLVVPILFATACGTGSNDKAKLADDLRRDLEATAGSRIELASNTGAYQPMRFVSEIEQSEASTPVERVRAPKRVASRTANVQQEESTSPAPEATEEIQVAETPAETPEAPAPASDVPSVPTVSPRPVPMQVDYPSSEGRGSSGSGRGEGRGVEIGDVIGVVIRGGGVRPDHCPPRRGGRGRIPVIFRFEVAPPLRPGIR